MKRAFAAWSVLALLSIASCSTGIDSSPSQGPARLVAFTIGDCDGDGVGEVVTALLYDEYCAPDSQDLLHVASGGAGNVLGDWVIGTRPKHASRISWACGRTAALGVLERLGEAPDFESTYSLVSCGGALDLRRALGIEAKSRVLGVGVRADGAGGIWLAVCSAQSSSPDSVACDLCRWTHGAAVQTRRFAFTRLAAQSDLQLTVGQFSGDAEPDVAIGDPGHSKGRGAVHLLDGRTGELHLLIEGMVDGALLGKRIEALHGSPSSGFDPLIVGAEDRVDPGRGRGWLFACDPAAPTVHRWDVEGKVDFDGIESSLHVLQDIDDDGFDDVAFIDDQHQSASILSGRTGVAVRQLRGAPWRSFESIASCSDFDGDSRPDLLLAVRPARAPGSAPDPADRNFLGSVVLSSADGRTLRRFPATSGR